MYNVNKCVDVQLNVQLVYVALIHEYPYEGPCRFGPWETLTTEFDELNQAEIFKMWSSGYGGAIASEPGIHLLEPLYIRMSDEFFITDEEEQKMADRIPQADIFIFTGMRGEGIARDFAMRYHVPVACEGMFGSTVLNSVLTNRGFESYAVLDIPDAVRLLRALRTRKALRTVKVLAVNRNNSQTSMGAQDAFLSNDEAMKRLGVRFQYFSFHEFMDMMHVNEHGKNPSLPGRNVYNLTEADAEEAGRWADELIADSVETDMNRDYVVNSVKAAVLIQKLCGHFGCNAFTAVCPDGCATRRMNEEQFTFCFSHSLLNEKGIPSGCEYDLLATLSIAALAALTGKAPYQGNTQPMVWYGKRVEGEYTGVGYIEDMERTQNIYYSGHATPNRLMHGFDKEKSAYALRSFTNSGWGATMRIDFNQNKGETITLMRFNPQCNKILAAKGTCIGGFGYHATGCSEGIYFEVEDKYDYFHKQAEFGLHMPLVFGDHIDDIKMLGKVLGMEVVIV
ncbi:L-fucose isomerase and related proteins [uncultured Roseburia sp.]|uniref:L-fucose isomerase and related proteins n=1 Tax=Brotonthovivens ammoniilytica TaxID=2981725 RepID=A0ABT2TK67_9FIRM|nr:hypothetical protein [Brotonthovivens ammoniilytica]MCU6762609.1 hypothetical protein [Brotonthovivens ammoniilytica]SCI77251.1 L-fucose isomerase and related proteins [uncultured Roseburia sp.]